MINEGHEVAGYSLNTVGRGLLAASPLWIKYDRKQWGWYAASYLSLRFGSFDPMYNATRGLDLDYTGTTSCIDKNFWGKLKPKSKLGIQSFFFGLGTVITLQYHRNTTLNQ